MEIGTIEARLGVAGGINQDEQSDRKLSRVSVSDCMRWSGWVIAAAYKTTSEVDTSCARVGAVEPLRLGEAEQSLGLHV